jgi:hypothetical protein
MTKILTDMTTMIAFYMIPLATNSILLWADTKETDVYKTL